MLHRAKAKLSNIANVDLKVVSFKTTKVKLVVVVIGFVLVVKFIFGASCSADFGFFSGSTKPISVDTSSFKMGTSDQVNPGVKK